MAPLVQCDYCPLLFHMDCLDPPLTAMPTGRWMCPNHMEHLVVSGVANPPVSSGGQASSYMELGFSILAGRKTIRIW